MRTAQLTDRMYSTPAARDGLTPKQRLATMREAVRRYARHMKAGELKKAAALAVVMAEVANWLDGDAWEAMGEADDDVGD